DYYCCSYRSGGTWIF
nr:immunoglobulin light chain junction region [Macaca mulatta]MOW57715.1 immunoglobulin light chain junction region [Macaca mulatta]MOW58683.1 immunoglobulin light chain junction region [Macaca mulatta]MOW58829.1 immunoglobulin light chain junction region [Macaca mulatta]MOW60116.1 immunoglobulin light chain junction region [Macaca mulatta]